EVREQVAAIEAHLEELHARIAELDAELTEVAADIARRTEELHGREALLEEHLRAAYERSQTSLLEILLSARSLDEATTEAGYLMTVSDQDRVLADEIRSIREELEIRRATLADGRRQLAMARELARQQEAELKARRE